MRLWRAVLLLLALVAPLQAQTPRITVAYEEFPLYSSTSADGAAVGFSIGMIERLASVAGYEVSYVAATNPARALRMIETGEADLTTLLALTPERLERGLPTLETGSFELTAFVLRNRGFESPQDLAGLRVGAVAGSFGLAGARMIPFSEIVEFPTTDGLIVPLLTGEIDAIVSTRNVVLSRLRKAGVESQVAALTPALRSAPYGFVISKSRPDLQAALNDAIRTSLKASDIALLEELWFGRPARLTENPVFWLVAGVIAISAVVVGVMALRLLQQSAEASRLLKANAANDLLVHALDEMSAAILIYDRDMRPIHRNAGFAKCFPSLVPDLGRGQDMRSLIARSYHEGVIKTDLDAAEIDALADRIVESARKGAGNRRTVHCTNGLVFDARDFRVGPEHFASIRVDVTDQYAQRETIRQQAASLQKANEQLQNFSSIAAHDLRAPLRHVSTLVDFARDEFKEADVKIPPAAEQYFGMLKTQTARMMQLVEDLLLYAQAGTPLGRPQRFNPMEPLRNAAALAGNSGGFLVVLPEDMPPVYTDPTAFEAVMRNLINNAIKHHDREEGRICIDSKLREGFVDICISDDGAGIAEEHREVIFQPFKRLNTAQGGSGLGLSYIKDTVEGWGGEVSVTAAKPRGTAFTVSVPTSDGLHVH